MSSPEDGSEGTGDNASPGAHRAPTPVLPSAAEPGIHANPTEEFQVSQKFGSLAGGPESRERLMQVPVEYLMSRDLHTLPPGASLRDAAALMQTYRVSCIPVIEAGRPVGLLRESDLAALWTDPNAGPEDPVAGVMRTGLPTVNPRKTLFDVLAMMTRYRVAHVQVLVGDQLVGLVTQTDIVRRQTASSVFMVIDIARLGDSDAIGEVVARVPRVMQAMADDGSNAREAGRVITSVCGAVTRRLIELAIARLGPAPVPFAWLACGSQGRRELTTTSDQDNLMVIDDRYDEQQHGAWFGEFARCVCTGLDAAGYAFCDGDMMAMNPRWRLPLSRWLSAIDTWVATPDTESRMMLCALLDARAIDGAAALNDTLQGALLSRIGESGSLVSRMVGDALTHPPALGLFGQIAVETKGLFRSQLDLKHGAIRPIVELARLHAALNHERSVNTVSRLQSARSSRILTRGGARDLLLAYEYVTDFRLVQQAIRVRGHQAPDDYLSLDQLSRLEQDHLRSSLGVIRNIQRSLARRMEVSGI